jgi:hypothetical protein
MGVIARMVVVAVLVAVLTVSMIPKQKGYGMAGINIIKTLQEMFTKSSPQTDILNYLNEKGYSDKAAAGILANIELETGGSFDYQEQEDLEKPGDGKGEGYGLFQYSNEMKDSYNEWKKSNDRTDSMESQIDFMDDVVKGNWAPGLANMDRAILKGELFSGKFEPDRIAKSFNSIFEKGKLETDYGNRQDLANKIYEEYF